MTDQPTPEEQAKIEPTPETLAKSADTGSEQSVAAVTHARRRSPAVAFLIGAAIIGAIAVLAYLFWGTRAETPATPEEAAITDEALGLPAPDAASVRAQVDRALRETPRDAAQPAEDAAADAQAQTQPERNELPPAPDDLPVAPPADASPPPPEIVNPARP